MLHSSRAQLQRIVSSYAPRPLPGTSSTCEDPSSSKRKAQRTSVDQSAGRADRNTGAKGLRHFSAKVCEKVKSQGRTTYNQVAEDLVKELCREAACGESGGGQYDEKNIRRRVYDALNVLMAMDIIQKDKKDIIWKGTTSEGPNLDKLIAERVRRISELERKQAYLQELMDQHTAIKQLLARDPERRFQCSTALHLPFILIQARPDATVEVKISDDMQDVAFDFYNSPFQIHDDAFVLKHMAAQQHQGLAGAGATVPNTGMAAAQHTVQPMRAQCVERPPSRQPSPSVHAPCVSSSMQDGSTQGPTGLEAPPPAFPNLPPLSSVPQYHMQQQQQQQHMQHFPSHFMQQPLPLAFAM